MEPSSRGNSAGLFPLRRLVQRQRGRRARNRCADLYRVVRFLSTPRFSLSAAVAAEVVFPGVAAALLRLLRRIKFFSSLEDGPSSPVKFGGGLFALSLGWPRFGWSFLSFILVGGPW